MNETEIFIKIEKWIASGKTVALATVIETWGSSPRPVGSIMAVNDSNEILGSVSGGCIESSVFTKALEIMKTNKSQVLEYGVSNTQAWDAGLTCGGKVRLYLEKLSQLDKNTFKKINATIKKGASLGMLTCLVDGNKSFVTEKTVNKNSLLEESKSLLFKKLSSCISFENREWFFKSFSIKLKIVVVGAVHITEPLVRFSNILGYESIIIDPRYNYKENNFSKDIQIIKDWPDEALRKLKIDNSTAIITLTHDPKLDDPAIRFALNSNCFYVGCLGSKKTHNSRVLRLKKAGFTEKQIKRIFGPVGIDINAKTPQEIANSIISQIISVKNNYDI
tara:strand:+ start:138 stop:1139 length:1002 start_codon:yes stop_codon:yes gene_type:complete